MLGCLLYELCTFEKPFQGENIAVNKLTSFIFVNKTKNLIYANTKKKLKKLNLFKIFNIKLCHIEYKI